jgi:hypothetical protein
MLGWRIWSRDLDWERTVKELIVRPLKSIVLSTILMVAFMQMSEAQTFAQTARKCSAEADARGLHGLERREFRSLCKAKGAQAAPIVAHPQAEKNVAGRPVNVLPDQVDAEPKTTVHPSLTATPSKLATVPISIAATYGRRIALVIGNSSYKNVPALANPRNDATSIAEALRRTGFTTVDLQLDLGREQLISVLRAFARHAEAADWAVVYYAGHGMEVGGVNYVIPVDARIAQDRDINFEAVPLDQILNATERAKQLHLVILDACRDNPFANQMKRTLAVASRSVSQGLAAVEPEAGTLVVFSAKDGETSLDGDGINSPFATALLRNLETPGLEVRRLFDFIRDDVLETTQRRQKPFSYGSISGRKDFYFVSSK